MKGEAYMNNNQYMPNNYPVNNSTGYFTGNTPKMTMTVDVINSEQEMYSYYVPPGVTTVLLDFTHSVMYIKATDFNGIPKNVVLYDLHERVVKPQNSGLTDTNGLQSQIDELKQMLVALTQQNKSNNNNQKKGGNQ